MRRKKPETTAFAIRLPVTILAELDDLAQERFEARAGLASRIVLDWVLSQRRADRTADGGEAVPVSGKRTGVVRRARAGVAKESP